MQHPISLATSGITIKTIGYCLKYNRLQCTFCKDSSLENESNVCKSRPVNQDQGVLPGVCPCLGTTIAIFFVEN